MSLWNLSRISLATSVSSRISFSRILAIERCPGSISKHATEGSGNQQEVTPAIAVGNAVHDSIAELVRVGGFSEGAEAALASNRPTRAIATLASFDPDLVPEVTGHLRRWARLWDELYANIGDLEPEVEFQTEVRAGLIFEGSIDLKGEDSEGNLHLFEWKSGVRRGSGKEQVAAYAGAQFELNPALCSLTTHVIELAAANVSTATYNRDRGSRVWSRLSKRAQRAHALSKEMPPRLSTGFYCATCPNADGCPALAAET